MVIAALVTCNERYVIVEEKRFFSGHSSSVPAASSTRLGMSYVLLFFFCHVSSDAHSRSLSHFCILKCKLVTPQTEVLLVVMDPATHVAMLAQPVVAAGPTDSKSFELLE